MAQWSNMSSDRIMACRVFDGEIRKIKALYTENDPEWIQLKPIIKYLEGRMKQMQRKGHYSEESDYSILHDG